MAFMINNKKKKKSDFQVSLSHVKQQTKYYIYKLVSTLPLFPGVPLCVRIC